MNEFLPFQYQIKKMLKISLLTYFDKNYYCLILIGFDRDCSFEMKFIVNSYKLASYNKDGNFRSCLPSRAGRAMGNGSFERSWTPHDHTMWPFLIFALPALPGVKIALPPL